MDVSRHVLEEGMSDDSLVSDEGLKEVDAGSEETWSSEEEVGVDAHPSNRGKTRRDKRKVRIAKL